MAEIRRERTVDSNLVPPLDPSLFEPSARDLEFLHAKISKDDEELRKRIAEVQEEAYKKYPYPCIRGYHHVRLTMSANPIYLTVLEAGKHGDTLFLDIGCCMGTDVRKLTYDGYPASRILATDIRQDFIDLGYKLYQDEAACQVCFFVSDIFELPVTTTSATTISRDFLVSEISDLSQLIGSLTHIYIGAVFHLFDESTQYAIGLRLAVLLKREGGSIIFGRHRGLAHEGMIDDHLGRTRYGHSERSWPFLWKKVFTEVESAEFAESRLKVDARLDEPFSLHISDSAGTATMLVWSVQII